MNRLSMLPRLSRAHSVLLFIVAVVAVVLILPATPAGLVAAATAMPLLGGAIMDAQCVLSDAQALTVTAYSTNTYDTGAAGNNVDVGEPLALCFSVDVAAKTSNADETYQFAAIQSANADLSSEDVLVQTTTAFVTRAFLTAGKRFYIPLPPGLKTKRYLGAKYTLGGTAPTLTISTDIRPLSMVQNEKYYASGIKVSS